MEQKACCLSTKSLESATNLLLYVEWHRFPTAPLKQYKATKAPDILLNTGLLV